VLAHLQEGLKAYFKAKIEEAEIAVRNKTQNLRRLEAQRNELNTKGAWTSDTSGDVSWARVAAYVLPHRGWLSARLRLALGFWLPDTVNSGLALTTPT
jgi:hypothetical protein